MATITPRPDEYNKSIFSFYVDSFIDTSKALVRALSDCAQFNKIFFNAFAQAYPIYLNTISEYNKSWKDLSELDKILRSRFRYFLSNLKA
jgi:hypothetical protein